MSEIYRAAGPCGTISPRGILNAKDADRRNRARTLAQPELEAVHLMGTKWDRTQLRVTLSGGTEAFRQRVASVAARWSDVCGIQFTFTAQAGGDIRVSLDQNGVNRSEVGNRAQGISQDEPTLMLGNLNANAPSFEFDYFVLHEFGHALGLVHEHQSPTASIRWRRAQVLDDCRSLFGWDPPTVEAEIFRPFASSDVDSTAFDQLSVMNYPILEHWTEDGLILPRRSALSPVDQQFIGRLYPK